MKYYIPPAPIECYDYSWKISPWSIFDYVVTIKTGKYEGVTVIYKNSNFVSSKDGTSPTKHKINFDYTIVEKPKHLIGKVISSSKDFLPILTEIIVDVSKIHQDTMTNKIV